tara:strand:+ start:1992 stop:2270 length:279 start_codon:yes stop_codon:yes gene_type:complete
MGQRRASAVAGRDTQKGMEGGNADGPSPSAPSLENPFLVGDNEKFSFRGSGGPFGSGGVNRFAGGIFSGFGQKGFGKTEKSYSKSYLDEAKN